MTREEAEQSIKYRVSDKRVICEVWREIWDLVEQIDEKELRKEIKEKIIDGFIMGKKMNDRLLFYKKEWAEGEFEPNPDMNEDIKKREFRMDSELEL